MSVVTQVSGSDPQFLWIMGSIPIGVALDLTLGNLPGRAYPFQWLRGLIEVVEDGLRRTVVRLGGGRGGDLFGGSVEAVMVVGTTASVVWLVVDVADLIGGPASLVVRSALIAAGLAIRSSGERILQAIEAPNLTLASQCLTAVGGRPPSRLQELGVGRVCVAAVGEVALREIVAPLFWLAVGGPAAFWGYLALRTLMVTQPPSGHRSTIASQVVATLTNLAEAIPAILSWILMAAAAGVVRANGLQAWRGGWTAGRSRRGSVLAWPQGTLSGALGVQIAGGPISAAGSSQPSFWVGEPTQPLNESSVIRAVRIMQVTALISATLAWLVTMVW